MKGSGRMISAHVLGGLAAALLVVPLPAVWLDEITWTGIASGPCWASSRLHQLKL